MSEAVEETKEARRAARDVPSLQAEVARLETLLSEAGIGSNESSKIEALRKEVARLRKALTVPEAREGAVGPRPAETRRRHTALEQSPDRKDTIRTLRKDITRLNNEVGPAGQADPPAEQAPRPGEAEHGDHQGDRQEAVQRVPSAPSGGEDIGPQRGPCPVAVRRGFLAAPCPGGVQGREGEVEGPARQSPGGRGDAVEASVRRGLSTARDVAAIAAPEDDAQRAAQGERPAAQDRAEVGDPESGAGGSACQASRDREGTRVRACRASSGQEDVVEVAVRCRRRSPRGSCEGRGAGRPRSSPCPGRNARLRKGAKTSRNRIETLEAQLERLRATGAVLSKALYGRKSEQAGQTALGAQARPAARRARPRPHPAAQARGAYRRAQPAAGCVRLRTVRAAQCAERRRGIHPRRDRGQGPQAGDPPSALAPDLQLRVVAHGSVGAAGAAPVPQNALRDQLLGALPVRALCLLAPRAPRCRVDVRPGAGGLAGDAGQ